MSTTAMYSPRRIGRETAHLLLDLPVGVAGFSLVVAALATGASLAITLVGVPILAATMLLARGGAELERSRARTLLGTDLAAPPARTGGTTALSRLTAPLKDRAARRASGYFLLLGPVGTTTFSLAVTWWATVAFLVTLPAWSWALPAESLQFGDHVWTSPGELAASTALGLLLLAVTPYVIHAIAGLDRALLRLLDGRPSPDLQSASC
jgi:hypothetical protein